MSERRGPRAIDHAVEVLVYLPVGFVLELPAQLPKFIDRGRREFELVKVLGRHRLTEGIVDAEGGIVRLQHQAMQTLRAMGLLPPADDAADEGQPSTTRFDRDVTSADAPPPEQARVALEPSSEPPADPPAPRVDVTTLAIPDYDSLSASQVIPRLEGLTRDELEAVRRYEAGGRGRKTILNRVAQLQGD